MTDGTLPCAGEVLALQVVDRGDLKFALEPSERGLPEAVQDFYAPFIRDWQLWTGWFRRDPGLAEPVRATGREDAPVSAAAAVPSRL